MIRLTVLFFLISSSLALAETEVSCSYQDKERGLEPVENCGRLSEDGLLKLNKMIVDRIDWNKYGLDCALVHGTENQNGWYFINQKGEGRISPFIQDNDCAPFSGGVAVGLSYGKVIFYDQAFNIIKRTEYVWASSFHEGFAKVCEGNLEKEYDSSGEKYKYHGGKCGFIDTKFKVVVPVTHPYEKTPIPSAL